jgi:hypothetical protein
MKKTHSVANLIQLADCMRMRENALFNAGGHQLLLLLRRRRRSMGPSSSAFFIELAIPSFQQGNPKFRSKKRSLFIIKNTGNGFRVRVLYHTCPS